MPTFRKTKKISSSALVNVAPGVRIKRPFPGPAGNDFDPFLMLDHFGPREVKPGHIDSVPDHPHRGFEPITFLFDGSVEHKDSMGNHSTIKGGDVQWMTAGSGVVHAEYISAETRRKGGSLHGIQLWVNLPRKHKMTKPKYQNLRSNKIPVVPVYNGEVRVVAGTFQGKRGPAKTFSPIIAWEIRLEEKGSFEAEISREYTALAYVMQGTAKTVDNQEVKAGRLVHFDKKGDFVGLKSEEGAHILFLAGEPLFEPVVAHGPFVMNSKAEILKAVRDFEEGKMGRINV